ncbi:MAG: hypothetical protein ACE5GT_06225, partial [Rhodospirillales bacterium]
MGADHRWVVGLRAEGDLSAAGPHEMSERRVVPRPRKFLLGGLIDGLRCGTTVARDSRGLSCMSRHPELRIGQDRHLERQ